VTIKSAAHPSLFWGLCAPEFASRFINTLAVGDTACASQSQFDYPGVTAFPLKAKESPAVTPGPGNRVGAADLRVARVAVDTALDALKRSFASESGDGPGLRGGTFHTDYGDDGWTTTLTDSRWTGDVAVSGTLQWAFGPLDAELDVDGPGGHDGTPRLAGGWQRPDVPRRITVSGTLNGERVRASMASF
jgi:hypothetical protein